MNTQRLPLSDWAFVLAGVVAIATIVAIALLAATEATSGGVLAVIAGLLVVYLTVMVLAMAVASTSAGRLQRRVGVTADNVTAILDDLPQLELMDAVPIAPPFPAYIGVARAEGVCPLGFRPGHTWDIDAEGRLSKQLCRPAVAALGAVLGSWSADGAEHTVSCHCPLDDREVIFTLQPKDRVAA